ncbi:sigma-54-dependent transcriptional regulator [Variovorax sp. Root411]|uniref:sigma-54-dependent transcriptional regulator n=1 Tax=Variovorax sp. Root411 TaxID=1736530 RepID=UPI0006FFD3B0|nr:sigma-54 dependent transcriptional regulator [Variovorax sp. Root411]KQW54338.1 AAA family ATPase [Variovorax sp. Root411]
MSHALVVEDDEDSAQVIAAMVAREGHTVMCAHSIASARRLVAMQRPELLLLDLHLPDGSGFDLIAEPGLARDCILILMTGQASLETSIKALRLGAADYLVKPINPQHLKGLLSRLIPPAQLRAEIDEVQELWRETGRFGHIIGRSQAMQRVYRQVSRVAGTAVTVFVHGESGTGKELVARAVHDLSRRRDQPFLAVNCGALSPHLIESEIFGHERGSFTGAERQHQGFFERAHGGTLFLDEVTEMPLELQVKLLRVLESGTFMRVGSTQVQQTDVRIIAATNRDAQAAVARGLLREDLLYRLNVFPIALPPLRERGDDVALIADSFLQEQSRQEGGAKRFSPAALARLAAHRWPGNVRELRNVVQRAWVMASGDAIDEEWLPAAAVDAQVHGGGAMQAPAPSAERRNGGPPHARLQQEPADNHIVVQVGSQLADVERRLILATYELCGRHKERTAALLGISMKTLYNRLKEYRQ